MASTGKKKTTMAKLARESRLRERRQEKAARKRARKDAAAQLANQVDAPPLDYDAGDDPATDDGLTAADTADTEVPTIATPHPAGSSAGSPT